MSRSARSPSICGCSINRTKLEWPVASSTLAMVHTHISRMRLEQSIIVRPLIRPLVRSVLRHRRHLLQAVALFAIAADLRQRGARRQGRRARDARPQCLHELWTPTRHRIPAHGMSRVHGRPRPSVLQTLTHSCAACNATKAVIDCAGSRLVATSYLPVNDSTLIYGMDHEGVVRWLSARVLAYPCIHQQTTTHHHHYADAQLRQGL